jgi:molybdopterin synthase catalytic subunit
MRVCVLYFGMLKDLAGQGSESIELPAGAVVSDLLVRFGDLYGVPEFMLSLAVSVNQEYANLHVQLHDGDEVGLLPPVSGGAAGLPAPAAIPRTKLVQERIDCEAIIAAVKQPADGACVVFEGIVRNHSRGRETLFLDYEAYEPMAAKQLEKLAGEALNKFTVRELAVIHRLGKLEIGETSVLIVVVAAHRGPAFEACRWLIDTLKRTVPIWKKEHFADGAVWADGDPFPGTEPTADLDRFKRI